MSCGSNVVTSQGKQCQWMQNAVAQRLVRLEPAGDGASVETDGMLGNRAVDANS